MRRRKWMTATIAAALVGCSSSGDVNLLETRLRQKEDMILEMEGRLAQMRSELSASQVEMASLREQVQSAGKVSLVSEQATILARAEKIAFHRLLTSGLNQDEAPGDERLSVLLMPLDSDGDLVKLAGAIELSLYDYSLPAGQQQIGRWTFSPDEAREAWHKGFTAAGYLFELPWQTPPNSRELTLHGRLTAPDGRQFDTTTSLAVRLPTAAIARSRAPLAMPIERTAGTVGKAVGEVQELAPLPEVNGTPISDRYPIDEIPVRR